MLQCHNSVLRTVSFSEVLLFLINYFDTKLLLLPNLCVHAQLHTLALDTGQLWVLGGILIGLSLKQFLLCEVSCLFGFYQQNKSLQSLKAEQRDVFSHILCPNMPVKPISKTCQAHMELPDQAGLL